MDELVPVALAAVIWLCTTGRTRLVLSVVAVGVSGLVATVVSGEYPRTGSARTKLGGDTM